MDDEAPPVHDAAGRYDALEGLLRRLASAAHADRWLLRGSLLTRIYCAPWPRHALDLDLLDLDPFERERTEARMAAVAGLALDDDCGYAVAASEVIWEDSSSPGMRFRVEASAAGWAGALQVDVASHDPVVPPPRWLDYPTARGGARVLVCTRETLIGWKLEGLFEKGLGTFRPKDLYDLALLTRGATLDDGALAAAIVSAFRSRGTPVVWAERLAEGHMGTSRWSQRKWGRFSQANPALGVPPIEAVVAEVAAALGPTLRAVLEGP